MTLRRILVGLAAVLASVVVLVAITLGVLIWRFNPNAYKGRIEASVRNATGLGLKLNGPIGVAWALHPTVTLADVAVANPPGFPTPDLARVARVTVRMDLPALIDRRVVVQSLTLQHPQVILERSASGGANWLPPPAGSAPVAPPRTPAEKTAPSRRPVSFAVREIRVENLELQYRDARAGVAYSAALPLLLFTAPTPQAPMKLIARGEANGRRFEIDARTASMQQVLSGGGPAPLSARLHAVGPGEDLILDVAAPAEDRPIHLALSGRYRAQPITLTADLGRQGVPLLPDKPLAVKLDGEAAGSRFAVNGVIADPANLSGVDLALTAASPDFLGLAALLDTKLPDLHALAVSGQLRDAGGLRRGFSISDLKLASQQGDLAGTLKVVLAPHRGVTADLHGARLDLAALRMVGPARAIPIGPQTAPSRASPAVGHVIPDQPFPLAALRQETADVSLRFDTLQAESRTFHDVQAEAHLHDGLLAAKVHAVFDGGATDLDATVDFRSAAPILALAVKAPALPAGQLLAALGAPAFVTGRLALAANLRGAGETPHLIAATLSGIASLTMQNGTIATNVLERAIGPAMARANPLAMLLHGDTTRLRCLAVRAQATNGRVILAPILLSSDLLTVSGSGTADLAAETLALHLRPQGRAGSVGFSVPLTLSGPWRDPRAKVVKGEPVSAMLGLLKGVDPGTTGPTCADALAQAGGAAPVPQASGNKGLTLPKAAGLLRQLLR